MNLHSAKNASEILSIKHLHIGRVDQFRGFNYLLKVFFGKNRKLVNFEILNQRKSESVALSVDSKRFLLTITNTFVLLTLQEGSLRIPLIQKRWKRQDSESNKKELQGFVSKIDTYIDSDGLKWEHSYGVRNDEDELVAFNSLGEESILLTIEPL